MQLLTVKINKSIIKSANAIEVTFCIIYKIILIR